MPIALRDKQTILFIGDSITDCGRRGGATPYGDGYVKFFRDLLILREPHRRVAIINKGISGDNAVGLKNRWNDDVLYHRPDWLSVKIGINDCHRFLAGVQEHGPDEFRKDYDLVLSQTREETKAQILLIDPFYISTDRTGLGARTQVLKLLPEYISTVHDMAKKHKARLVRTHDLFQKHLESTAPDFFCPEPVHPFRSGHLFIALEVMKTLTA